MGRGSIHQYSNINVVYAYLFERNMLQFGRMITSCYHELGSSNVLAVAILCCVWQSCGNNETRKTNSAEGHETSIFNLHVNIVTSY